MAAKVTFDPLVKIIYITAIPDSSSIVEINIKTDVYSDGKEDWLIDANLSKFRFPVEAIGGNPLPGGRALGSSFFLKYGWRIRPYEATHTLRIDGNLYTEEGDSPFIPTVGAYTVGIISNVSSLIEAINIGGGSGYTPQQVATAVWSDTVTNYATTNGSFGQYMGKKLLSIKTFLGLK